MFSLKSISQKMKSNEKEKCLVKEDYILFIDEDMAYHSDFLYQNISSPVTPENYFNSIVKFLEFLAEKTGYKIKIAAHPRSNYTGEREFVYGNLPIYKGDTGSLIKSAKLVIGHASTSFQFAVLYKIPILSITTNELINSNYNEYILKFSETLGIPILNIDDNLDDIDWRILEKFDNQFYDNYLDDYVKCKDSPIQYSMKIINEYFLPFVG